MRIFFKFTKNQIERIKKNLFAKLTSEFFQIISQVLYPPLMILFWGIDKFGIWLFLTSLTAMFAMFNFNFTAASLQQMSIYNNKKKFNKVNEIFQNTFGLIIINLLLLSTIIIVYFLLFEIDFSITKELNLKEVKIIIFLILFSVYIDIFSSLLNIGIWHRGKQYISVNILTTLEIISKLSIAITGLFFESLVYAAIILVIFSILKIIIFYYYFNLFNSYLKFSLKKFTKEKSFNIIKLSVGHFSDLLAYTIKNSGLIVVIGIFFNANLVAYISTAKTLFYFFPVRFFNVIESISLYEYAKSFAKKNFYILKHNHKKHILFVLLISFLFMLISIFVGPYIYKVWLSGKFEITLLLLILIILDVFVNTFRNSIVIILRSTNNMLNIGIIELIISSLVIFIYYYFFTLGYKIETSFLVIIFGSITSLLFSIFYVRIFYKNKFINLK